ncbi:MAG: type III pantothenate kinase [Bradymonadia bacterium]
MLFAIDIGNSHTVCGVYDGTQLRAHWRISTQSSRTRDELRAMLSTLFLSEPNLQADHIDAAIIASVVPAMTQVYEQTATDLFNVNARIVGPGLKTGMPIRYEDPREVGADRIVNAVAAYRKWQTGVIVVDFGTATTFDVVSLDGAYLGGVICPGIKISSEALFNRAAKLPKVAFNRPRSVIGRNTVSSIQSGLVYGYVGLVEGLIARIKSELDFDCKVIATGGLAREVAASTNHIEEVDEMLTLEGLRVIHQLNTQQVEAS